MARVRTTKYLALANAALLRPSIRCQNISHTAAVNKLEHEYQKSGEVINEYEDNGVNWIPHPRSGIYFPQGHDRVLDDVPSDASKLKQYWIRNVDGAEKHDPDISSADHYLLASHRA